MIEKEITGQEVTNILNGVGSDRMIVERLFKVEVVLIIGLGLGRRSSTNGPLTLG